MLVPTKYTKEYNLNATSGILQTIQNEILWGINQVKVTGKTFLGIGGDGQRKKSRMFLEEFIYLQLSSGEVQSLTNRLLLRLARYEKNCSQGGKYNMSEIHLDQLNLKHHFDRGSNEILKEFDAELTPRSCLALLFFYQVFCKACVEAGILTKFNHISKWMMDVFERNIADFVDMGGWTGVLETKEIVIVINPKRKPVIENLDWMRVFEIGLVTTSFILLALQLKTHPVVI